MLKVEAFHGIHDEVSRIFAPFLNVEHFYQLLSGDKEDYLSILAKDRVPLHMRRIAWRLVRHQYRQFPHRSREVVPRLVDLVLPYILGIVIFEFYQDHPCA